MANFVLSKRFMSISLAQWHSEACKACRAGLKPLEKWHASLQKILQSFSILEQIGQPES
jgi:hypothetical protein